MGDAATVVRPGLIVGPGDPTDRFTYWPVRVARGGEVLAPGDPDDPVQFIDVRDLAAFMLHLATTDTGGVFNLVGPASPLGIRGLLYGAKATVGGDARFTWVPQPFLSERGVRSWVEMPVWSYAGAPTYVYCTSRIDKALAAGLTNRPLADTIRDLLTWRAEQPPERREALRTGIAADREAEILAQWHAEGGA
jgi:2'-hydroxyisoflavone reductase